MSSLAAVAASSTKWFCRKRESLQQKASDERKQQEAQTAKQCAKSVVLCILLLTLYLWSDPGRMALPLGLSCSLCCALAVGLWPRQWAMLAAGVGRRVWLTYLRSLEG